MSFNYAANTGPAWTAHITVLGQPVNVTQASDIVPVHLSTTIGANRSLHIGFTNTPGASFTVLASTNLALPLSNWTPVGAPVENPPGQCEFTSSEMTNAANYFIIRSP